MPIDSIQMVSFRNHEETNMSFRPGINIIWGENGSGKTSVLEAIYLLSIGKSFKTNRTFETIMYDKELFKIKGLFSVEKKTDQISFSQSKDKRKKIKINNREVKKIELVGKNPVVLLSPEEQNITKGSHGDRRKYFNRLYSTVSKTFFKNLFKYTAVLKQRNALLKNNANNTSLHVWDEKLAEFGTNVLKQKKVFNEKFQLCLKKTSNLYNQSGVDLVLETEENNNNKERFLEQLIKARKKDMITKRTSVGPHKDTSTFLFNGKKLRDFGSQGEHKISLVLIKLTEYMFVSEEKRKTPVLLLDDLFAKLDFKRSDAVLELLNKKTQTIITNTDLVDIKNHGVNLKDPNNHTFYLERPCKN
jgi:DNA replication and repair protein RecF